MPQNARFQQVEVVWLLKLVSCRTHGNLRKYESLKAAAEDSMIKLLHPSVSWLLALCISKIRRVHAGQRLSDLESWPQVSTQ